jgi:hypothetical protein
VTHSSIRTLLSIVAMHDSKLEQLEFKTAFYFDNIRDAQKALPFSSLQWHLCENALESFRRTNGPFGWMLESHRTSCRVLQL